MSISKEENNTITMDVDKELRRLLGDLFAGKCSLAKETPLDVFDEISLRKRRAACHGLLELFHNQHSVVQDVITQESIAQRDAIEEGVEMSSSIPITVPALLDFIQHAVAISSPTSHPLHNIIESYQHSLIQLMMIYCQMFSSGYLPCLCGSYSSEEIAAIVNHLLTTMIQGFLNLPPSQSHLDTCNMVIAFILFIARHVHCFEMSLLLTLGQCSWKWVQQSNTNMDANLLTSSLQLTRTIILITSISRSNDMKDWECFLQLYLSFMAMPDIVFSASECETSNDTLYTTDVYWNTILNNFPMSPTLMQDIDHTFLAVIRHCQTSLERQSLSGKKDLFLFIIPIPYLFKLFVHIHRPSSYDDDDSAVCRDESILTMVKVLVDFIASWLSIFAVAVERRCTELPHPQQYRKLPPDHNIRVWCDFLKLILGNKIVKTILMQSHRNTLIGIFTSIQQYVNMESANLIPLTRERDLLIRLFVDVIELVYNDLPTTHALIPIIHNTVRVIATQIEQVYFHPTTTIEQQDIAFACLLMLSVFTSTNDILHRYDTALSLVALRGKLITTKGIPATHLMLLAYSLSGIAEVGGLAVVKVLLELQLAQKFVLFLQAQQEADDIGKDVSLWNEGLQLILSSVVNMCRHEDVKLILKTSTNIAYFTALYQATSLGNEQLKIKILLVFLLGDEERTANTGMEIDQATIDYVGDILFYSIRRTDMDTYVYGTFGFVVLLQVLVELSKSDHHKELLLSSERIYHSTIQFLETYVEGRNRYSRREPLGDGDCCALAIELLVQLAFHYPTDGALQQKYLAVSTDAEYQHRQVLEILDAVVKTTEVVVSNGCKQKIETLVARLKSTDVDRNAIELKLTNNATITTTKATNNTATANNKKAAKHVMVSYCWNQTANPQHVKQLSQTLRNMGIDVWRDEDGSSIVPPMSGSVDERMAEAIQMSDLVVICVSSAYKKSSNCRLEASYASVLNKRGNVKLIFVMMNTQYTTVSEPDFVDGWLGILVGGALWLPMWDAHQIATTAKAIAEQADACTHLHVVHRPVVVEEENSNTGDDSNNAVVATIPSLLSKREVSQSSTVEMEEAWEFLHNERAVLNSTVLQSFMEDIGLVKSSYLAYCHEEDIVKLSQHLKRVPQHGFIILMNRIRQTNHS